MDWATEAKKERITRWKVEQDCLEQLGRLQEELDGKNTDIDELINEKVVLHDEVEQLRKNETMLVETAKNRLDEVERLRKELVQAVEYGNGLRDEVERLEKCWQRDGVKLALAEQEVERLRAAQGHTGLHSLDADDEERCERCHLEAEVERLQANNAFLAKKDGEQAARVWTLEDEVKRLNYELGVVDYPGRGALVDEIAQLNEKLDERQEYCIWSARQNERLQDDNEQLQEALQEVSDNALRVLNRGRSTIPEGTR